MECVVDGDGDSNLYPSLENAALKKQDALKPVTKIDSEYVDRVMGLDLSKKDLALALAKEYGKEGAMEEALKDWQGQNVYRQADIADVVRNVLSKPEIIDAEFEETLESKLVPYETKSNLAKVALKRTVDLINKTCWYYPLVGMLPGKYQQKIADRLGEKSLHYSLANICVEITALLATSVTVGGSIGGMMYTLTVFYSMIRAAMIGAGNPLLTIPHHTIHAALFLKNNYVRFYNEEQKLLEQKSIDAEFTVKETNSETKNAPVRIEGQKSDFAAEEFEVELDVEEEILTVKPKHLVYKE